VTRRDLNGHRSARSELVGQAVSFWAVSRLALNHERLALHCLGLAGYTVYLPRLRERRISHGRRIEVRPPLFLGYAFVLIELQWHAARWAPGTLGLVMDGDRPAKVPDVVIAEIRKREVGGLIELPKSPPLRRGDRVRILRGPFCNHLAIFADMKPRERVDVLLRLLGGEQRVTMAKQDIEALIS
jgi:transcriptional antiterminator RfaH